MLEFIGNNLFWVSLWFAILMMLLWNLFSDVLMGIAQLEPMDVTRRINSDNAVIFDLRTESDFNNGHIIHSVNIPEKEITERKKEFEKYKDKPLILYCQTGSVATRVVRQLKTEGFEDISCLKGGILSWQRASLPLTRDKK
ncbi:MAG: rhodanese-like domain-containing protein [Gammaproteobacteria bacterium]|nr:rhodanese-like domain-containing protein [Gammaproteobacteria bacterium]